MIPFGLSSLMALSLPIARRATKCVPVDEPIPGAAALWLFDDGSGATLTDYSGNSLDGTLGADGAAPAWGVTGLTFDGGDYVTCGTDAALELGDDDHTLIVVATPTGVSGFQSLLGKLAYSNIEHWGLYLNGAGPTYRCCVNGGVTVYSTGPNVSAGAAAMITTTRSATEITTYTGTTAGTPRATPAGVIDTSARNFNIATRYTVDGQFFTGGIHAAIVYPFALTPAQIVHMYVYLKALLAPRGVTLA